MIKWCMRVTVNRDGLSTGHMVVHNAAIDPHRSEHGYYECLSCGIRTTSESRLGRCADCGGDVRNISIARE